MTSTSWLWAVLQQADAGAAAGAPQGAAGVLFNVAPIILMVGVMYVMILRPSMQQKRAHAQFLAGIKKDDEVVTESGIYGRVVAVEERVVVLEVADKVRIKVVRGRIQGAWSAAVAPPATPTATGRKVA